MSYIDTRNALFTGALSGLSVPVAMPNISFNHDNLDAWVALYFIPATSQSLGKTKASGDERRGLMQASVYIKADSVNYDNLQLQIIDQLTSILWNGSVLVSNGQEVHILESTANEGSVNGSYFKRDLTINYLAITQRI
tara:strand:- start:75 stop:488 length:414 start_codon:yes stop_codon:yes gene_type:complete